MFKAKFYYLIRKWPKLRKNLRPSKENDNIRIINSDSI